MPKFTRGDIVVSKVGASPRVVYQSVDNYVYVKYITTCSGNQEELFHQSKLWRYSHPLTKAETAKANEILEATKSYSLGYKTELTTTDHKAKEKDMLYQITQIVDGIKYTMYGNKLAVDSNGKWVMELKGGMGVMAFDEKDISEVTPYTIDVKFLDSVKVYSYMAKKKDGTKEGDLLVINSNGRKAIVLVVGVDTKSKAATKDIDIVGKVRVDAVN